MFKKIKIVLILFVCTICSNKLVAQKDTAVISGNGVTLSGGPQKNTKKIASTYNPNKAIIRSALIPGWGQITNKKIWKVPIVYAALGITGGIFFRNLRQYRESKAAYILASDTIASNDYLIKQPYYSVRSTPERIRTFRNEVRQNVDYSVLIFLIFWGLNVADAAVDAHLKTFDVSDDLTLQVNPGYSSMAKTNGISLVLKIGK